MAETDIQKWLSRYGRASSWRRTCQSASGSATDQAPRAVRQTRSLDVDALIRLEGDEDGNVSAQCRVCDRGGRPIAWYSALPSPQFKPTPSPYDEACVPTARTITDLLSLMTLHARETHG